jgi:uncharacterized membrane protein YidH (DUF202 family)
MSFKEKTAWVMGAIMIVAAGYYFNMVAKASAALGDISPPVIGFVIAYVVLVVIASVAAMIVLSIMNYREADEPADEREKQIIDKAGHWSNYVLAIGVIAGLFHYGVNQNGNMMFHIVFGSLMAAQIAEYGLQIWLYRRGV